MPSPRVRLAPRDLALLSDLADYRFLSVPQARALHFESESSASRRLGALARAGLAVKVFMPVRPFDRRVTSIFGLAKVGAEQLAARGDGVVPKYLTAQDRRSSLFLDHTLRRNDLRVCLELVSRRAKGFELLAWKQAPEEVRGHALIRTRDGPERWPCVPDGFAHVAVNGEHHGLVVEIDLGTVAVKRMLCRYMAYYRWWKVGGMAKRFGATPLRVLTLSTTLARLARLRGAAVAAAPSSRGSGLFWFGKLDLADLEHPERLLGAVSWTVARRGDERVVPLF